MDWIAIGKRIRNQREVFGYTREVFAEKIDVTPKFCSDIELGVKGMSVSTLCRISNVLNLSADYILFGKETEETDSPAIALLRSCPADKQGYLETIIKAYVLAVD